MECLYWTTLKVIIPKRAIFTIVMSQLTFKTLLMSAFILDFERVSGDASTLDEFYNFKHGKKRPSKMEVSQAARKYPEIA